MIDQIIIIIIPLFWPNQSGRSDRSERPIPFGPLRDERANMSAECNCDRRAHLRLRRRLKVELFLFHSTLTY